MKNGVRKISKFAHLYALCYIDIQEHKRLTIKRAFSNEGFPNEY